MTNAEAIETLRANYPDACFEQLREAVDKAIKALEAQDWIPCSERLPSYGEDVLVSISGYCNVGHIVPTNDEKQYNWYYSGWYHDPYDADAWMPLPEPYRGEENENR